MFQTISHSQDENKIQFVEMEEEHEDLSFTDIGIHPHKFIEIHVTSHTIDGVGMQAKTLYQIETRVKTTKIEFHASRRYRVSDDFNKMMMMNLSQLFYIYDRNFLVFILALKNFLR